MCFDVKPGQTWPQRGPMSIGTTPEGRVVRLLAPGYMETERSATITDPRVNAGAPTNIPTIHGGRRLSPDEAATVVARAGGIDPETGRKMISYSSIPIAENHAIERSASLGDVLYERFPWAFRRQS